MVFYTPQEFVEKGRELFGDAADTSQDTSEISQPVLYQISAWQVIATREWNGDNSLNLMNK